MHIVPAASRAVTLALLSLSLHVHAQVDTSNRNLTLRFLQDSSASCDYSASAPALTFTTSSVPLLNHCFNFQELFGGNATQGLVNQTANIAPPYTGEAGIHWQLENVNTYDPQTNYSSILYRQHITNPGRDDLKPGNQADRAVTLYASNNCRDLVSSSGDILGWYGFSCWSEDKGSCGTAPWKIGSFSIQDKAELDSCWVFAKDGAAGRGYSSSQAMVGAFFGASLAIWLA